MNTIVNTERPRLKLNLTAKPLSLNTNATPIVAGSAHKKVVVFEKPKDRVTAADSLPATSDTKDVTKDIPKAKSKDVKNSKKPEAAANPKVVASPEEIMKAKIKRRKKEYFSILTKLKADYPQVFSEEVKPLAIGIDVELKKILNGEFPNNQLNRFFHRYCGSFKYKEKLVEGSTKISS